MVLGLAAAAASAGGLFSYNRENFLFDKELQQKRDYQGQVMRIKQFELYREDIRDLVQLTVRKMDNYLLVNTLQLGFCITLLTDGRPVRKGLETDSPPWLNGLYAMCTCGAFLYYLLSMWLAMHASIAAHAVGVRMLTQDVRLPVPTAEQLDASTARAEDFEAMRMGNLLRVPLWRQQMKHLSKAMGETSRQQDDPACETASEAESEVDSAAPAVARLLHVKRFRKLQVLWQSYDAYARVCMALGTNQVLHALSYEALILLMAEDDVVWPALCCVGIFTTCAWTLAKLDLYLSRRILSFTAVLLLLPPFLTVVALSLKLQKDPHGVGLWAKRVGPQAIPPVVYFLHVVWIVFTTRVAKSASFGEAKLPTNFRSVLYLDVFGWLTDRNTEEADDEPRPVVQLPTVAEEVSPDDNATWLSGASTAPLPPPLRRLVLKDCRKQQRQLKCDIGRWERVDLEATGLEAFRELLKDFADESQRLCELDHEEPLGEAHAESPPETEPTVWLQMEYNPQGFAHTYYYRPETADTMWEVPAGKVRISSLQSMRQDVTLLQEKIDALLRRGEPESPRPSWPAPSVAGGSSPVRVQPRPTLEHTGDVFHPGPAARGPAVRRGIRPRRERANAKAGRLPWNTVWIGGRALAVAWMVGFLWVVLGIRGVKVPFEEDLPKPAADPDVFREVRVLKKPRLLSLRRAHGGSLEGFLPAFLRPEGMACNDALGPVALVVGRYAVQALDVEGGVASEPALGSRAAGIQVALDACLQQVPGFHGSGLAGIALDCPDAASTTASGTTCAAVLLRADGLQALRCDLGAAASSGSSEPLLLELLGGPWRAVAGGAGASLWAVEEGGRTVARLTPLRPAGTELRAEVDLSLAPPQAVLRPHIASTGKYLLVLEPAGRLQAWPLDGATPRAWQLPAKAAAAADGPWRGLCVSEGQLLLVSLGSEVGSGGEVPAFSIWRAELPHEL